jgi:uncharacterized protein (DUF1778 family)
LEERDVANVEARGSSPLVRTKFQLLKDLIMVGIEPVLMPEMIELDDSQFDELCALLQQPPACDASVQERLRRKPAWDTKTDMGSE